MELGRTCFEFTRLKKDGSPYFTSVRQRCITRGEPRTDTVLAASD